ncbi:MAG TPA: acetyl-CoA carboxylase biotin carboxyl carrier protein [Kofleriaceae bacterium]|jgi:acetyl-CoA carboxylase biotin carboxyl carrier protein|nr:acetyl-CoA carboxylase biotin carboxyl carrier protein [Kofleriaceae bacterium]
MAPGRKGPKVVEKKTNGGTGSSSVVDTVRGLAELVNEHALSELIYDTPELTITLRRGVIAQAAAVPMAMPAMPMQMPSHGGAPFTSHHMAAAPAVGGAAPQAAEPHDNAHVVTSPFVGTFYRRPNPDSSTYVELNQRVDKGAVLCIVEAMKLMNEIEADISGTVVGILAEDGAPVEYGQPLFKIAP